MCEAARNDEVAIFEIRMNLRTPRRLLSGPDRRSTGFVTLPARVELTCSQESPRIDVRVELENRATDHRLRVLFPTPIVTDTCAAESKFDVVERTVDLPVPKRSSLPWVAAATMRPEGACHHDGFVDLSDGKRGLALLTRGLPEYEILSDHKGRTVALTLLRSVSRFSRGDVRDRPFNAGIPLRVPGAACLGTHVWEYSILPHAEGWQEGGVLQQAHQFQQPFMVSRTDVKKEHIDFLIRANADDPGPGQFVKEIPREGPLSPAMSFIIVTPQDIVVSAIKKGSCRKNELVVRLYNPTNQAVSATIRLFREARSCYLLTLSEERLRRLPLSQGNEVKFRCERKQIVTLGFRM